MNQGDLPPQLADKIAETLIKAGVLSFLEIDGISMEPFIKNGEKVMVDHRIRDVQPGDIILFKKDGEEGRFIHRMVHRRGDTIITKGDNRFFFDSGNSIKNVLGKVTSIQKKDGSKIFIDEEPWKSICAMTAEISYKTGLLCRQLFRERTDEPSGEDYHRIAFELYKEDKKEEALEYFRRALACDPMGVLSRIDMGEILRQQEKYDEALIHLRLALEIDRRQTSKSAQAYNIIGNTLVNMGRIEESLEEYNSAVDVEPDFIPAHINRGWACFRMGKYDEAEADFRKVLQMEPKNYKTLKNLGMLNLAKENLYEAEKYLLMASSASPNDPDVLNNLALVSMKKGDLFGAEGWLNRALAGDPAHFDSNFNLGRIWQMTGKTKEALEHFVKMNQQYPGNSEIESIIAEIGASAGS